MHPPNSEECTAVFVSVLINNYNYAPYLNEAIESVLAQTYRNLEIIVVDDGSTDNSRALIEHFAAEDPRIVPHFKANGGQLSALNAGIAEARGDVLFFLDADDRYLADYVEKAVAVYTEHPVCDFLYCSYREFGASNELIDQSFPHRVNDVGFTGLLTFVAHCWIGAATSAISLRRSLAARFCPMPHEADWRIRADDCVILLASLHRGRKFYLDEPLVAYRTHASNNHFGNAKSAEKTYVNKLLRARLIADTARETGLYLHLRGEKLSSLLLVEASTGHKNTKLLEVYRKAIRANVDIPLLRRWRLILKASHLITRARRKDKRRRG